MGTVVQKADWRGSLMVFFLVSGLIIGFGLGIAVHDRDCKKCLRNMNGRL